MNQSESAYISATFICLANSRKKSGRCLAGKARYLGSYTKWIRPISEREHEELKGHEFLIHTGEEANILDILEVKLLSHQPKLHQQENYLMDVSVPLRKIGVLKSEDMKNIADAPVDLWGSGHSSKKGLNDFVPKELIGNYSYSLQFIHVEKIRVHVTLEWSGSWNHNQKVFRAEFVFGDNAYRLKITDPSFELDFTDKAIGVYEIEEAFLTISLGEEFNNSYWKLVAGVAPVIYGKNWISS